jgi:hypothetical protein
MPCLHCYIFLVSCTRVLVFNILDSKLKFLRKKDSFSLPFDKMDQDPAPNGSGSTTQYFCKILLIFNKQKHVSIHAGKGLFNKIFCAKRRVMPEYRYLYKYPFHCQSLAIRTVYNV